MFPVLIEIGPVTLYTYGLMFALGVLVAALVASHFGKRVRIAPSDVQDITLWALIFGLVATKALYIATELEYYLANPVELLKLWNVGMVFYGGVIGAIVGAIIVIRRRRLDPWDAFDSFAPGVALGHMLGRLGCLAAGCCYGLPTDSWIGVVFTDERSIAPTGIGLHPTQIYDALNEGVIFLILLAAWSRRAFKGQIILLWAGLYSIGRFIVEIYRGDDRGDFIVGALSPSQLMAIGALIVVGGLYLWRWRASRARTNLATP